MNSSIYVGKITHRRMQPTRHQFNYQLFMLYLDLDELPSVFDRYWLWSVDRRNVASFIRADHMGKEAVSLKAHVQAQIYQATGKRHSGPVRLLTHLRYFGHCFNPVSFYYCFDARSEELDFVVCEVHNTPWKEEYIYVLDASELSTPNRLNRYRQAKAFHVSPFLPMELQYEWLLAAPTQRLAVHMTCWQEKNAVFNASLALRRKPINSANLAKALINFPFITIKIVVLIHWQALRLWLKKVPFYPHPQAD